MLTVQDFENLIFQFRGKKIMLDSDLAALYETETKKLKQQVRRNESRFPEDFMFELTKEEKQELITNNPRLEKLKYSPVTPMVFTEQGVAMLSSVLTTERAVQINVGIMRAFAHYRTLLLENKELRKEIKKLDQKMNKGFKYVLDRIEEMQEKPIPPRNPIGFKSSEKNSD
ncbi:MAG: ORF6N domain-containing protein [Bacteroidota bacterium]